MLPSMNPGNLDVGCPVKQSEYKKKPKNYADHYNDVEDVLNLSVHRDIGVDQPEQHADDDQGDYE